MDHSKTDADIVSENVSAKIKLTTDVHTAAVVMGRAAPVESDEPRRLTTHPNVKIVKMIQRRKLKYSADDLTKLVLSLVMPGDDYDYFCCPGAQWWTSGLGDRESFAESFRLFDDLKHLEAELMGGMSVMLDAVRLNVYSLELVSGDIVLNYERSIYRADEPNRCN